MSHPSELIDELLKQHLKPAMKELGFKCKSSTFYRQSGDVIEVLSLQKSSNNDSAEGRFTINLGTYWPNVQAVCGGEASSSPPKEYECTVRQRLGPLFADRADYWWSVNPNTNIQIVGADVVEKIRDFGLPWLRRATSLDEVTKLAQPKQAIVFHTLRGETALATDLINQEIARSSHAKGTYRFLATKLGLQISSAS